MGLSIRRLAIHPGSQALPRKPYLMDTMLKMWGEWMAWIGSSLLAVFAFLNPAHLLIALSIASTSLTICYTSWKWRQEIRKNRSNGNS